MAGDDSEQSSGAGHLIPSTLKSHGPLRDTLGGPFYFQRNNTMPKTQRYGGYPSPSLPSGSPRPHEPRMTPARATQNGSFFRPRFPEKVGHPTSKKALKPRRCCLTFAFVVRPYRLRPHNCLALWSSAGLIKEASEDLGFSGPARPIPLPQRLRLVGAAKHVECGGSEAGAILGPGVIPSKNLVVCGESGLAERERFGRRTAEE
jgi:hypothetical protein